MLNLTGPTPSPLCQNRLRGRARKSLSSAWRNCFDFGRSHSMTYGTSKAQSTYLLIAAAPATFPPLYLFNFRSQLLIPASLALLNEAAESVQKPGTDSPASATLVPRPGVIEPFDRDRAQSAPVRGWRESPRPCGTLRLTRVRAFSLWIEDQNPPLPQPVAPARIAGMRLASGSRHNHANPSREPTHQTLAKNIARAESKCVAKKSPRKSGRHHDRSM